MYFNRQLFVVLAYISISEIVMLLLVTTLLASGAIDDLVARAVGLKRRRGAPQEEAADELDLREFFSDDFSATSDGWPAEATSGASDCETRFVRRYLAYCETVLKPDGRAGVGINGFTMRDVGRLSAAFGREAGRREIQRGGHWSPTDCTARQRLAVVVPCRDRELHLAILLHVLHPLLQRQLVQYTIFVVEQLEPEIFNKAALMNAAYREIQSMTSSRSSRQRPYDCFIFHDVDLLPENDLNMYSCTGAQPRHLAPYINRFKYKLPYESIFGGAVSFRSDIFERVNGFSNDFYGWGGEDDDMRNRVVANNLSVVRFPKCVASYTALEHSRDLRNPPRDKRLRMQTWTKRSKSHYARHGLNSISYRVEANEAMPLYTWLLVSLPPPPRYRLRHDAETPDQLEIDFVKSGGGGLHMSAHYRRLMLLVWTAAVFSTL